MKKLSIMDVAVFGQLRRICVCTVRMVADDVLRRLVNNEGWQRRSAVTSLIAKHAMFEIRISSRGTRFASETNTQMKSGTRQ